MCSDGCDSQAMTGDARLPHDERPSNGGAWPQFTDDRPTPSLQLPPAPPSPRPAAPAPPRFPVAAAPPRGPAVRSGRGAAPVGRPAWRFPAVVSGLPCPLNRELLGLPDEIRTSSLAGSRVRPAYDLGDRGFAAAHCSISLFRQMRPAVRFAMGAGKSECVWTIRFTRCREIPRKVAISATPTRSSHMTAL
jgi:hypothetical protein